ncbi:hypothetical protein SAMN05421812_105387 [Asanoa hainanensis]|uniref:Uncharacterized protein n=1 Tax=Asanoa hainanensis TaxID=560556 RepID=A0A239MFQ5_9ACTN|nr:hypothetical protein [Asanoa hainanensis]SNT41013.1 hypothetical protein SAMN05421812_105387 [Asanoa hainanensis]
MPNLPCRCRYVHDLSPIPDDGFQVLPDWATGKLLFTDAATTDEWELQQVRTAALTRLYSCPNCEAVMWDKAGNDEYTTYVPCKRLIRIYADLADRDEDGGVRLRHARTLEDLQRQRLLLQHGGYIVVHDGHDEVYVCLDEPSDDGGTWIARPIDDAVVADLRALGR